MDAIRRLFQRSKKEKQVVLHLEDMRHLTQGSNKLAMKLYDFLCEDKGNMLFSPCSISAGLAMLLSVARGETEDELRTALGLEHSALKAQSIAYAFEQHMSDFLNLTDNFTLYCSDMIVNKRNADIDYEYKAILAQKFQAIMFETDFAQGKRSVSQINEWVRMKTYDKIPKTVQTLDPESAMILFNVIYFSGKWLKKFPIRATRPESFYNKGTQSNSKRVAMMHVSGLFQIFKGDSVDAVQLPYVDKDVAMLVILPHAIDGLESVETDLSSSFIEEIIRNLREKKVAVTLPRFRLDFTKSLVPFYRFLGVEQIFDSGEELAICTEPPVLTMSEIFHKAVVEVNEQYNAATDNSDVEVQLNVEEEFVANHPFVFVIYHIIDDLIMFMGRVNEL